jgi:hypothetical protein
VSEDTSDFSGDPPPRSATRRNSGVGRSGTVTKVFSPSGVRGQVIVKEERLDPNKAPKIIIIIPPIRRVVLAISESTNL